MKKTYKFIGELAVALYSMNATMTYSTLMSVIKENCNDAYGNERGMAQGVAATYRAWEAYEKAQASNKGFREPITCMIIAQTFVNQQGYPSWYN